jgi:hypothetical protein
MRKALLFAAVLLAPAVLDLPVVTSSAEAAVACARGVVRAGCVATRPPPAAAAGCRYVNGRRVCGAVVR